MRLEATNKNVRGGYKFPPPLTDRVKKYNVDGRRRGWGGGGGDGEGGVGGRKRGGICFGLYKLNQSTGSNHIRAN